jgi:hypothetical protein
LSNGCAEPSKRLASNVCLARSTGPQTRITPKQAQSSLFKLAGNSHAPSDCFGWRASLLYPLRGKKKLGRHTPFIHQLPRLAGAGQPRRHPHM